MANTGFNLAVCAALRAEFSIHYRHSFYVRFLGGIPIEKVLAFAIPAN
jgi:hypothetical protein